MSVKIAVDISAVIAADISVSRLEEVLARIFGVGGTFLENDNIGHDLGTGITLESRVGKPDRAEKVSLLHNVAAHRAVLCVHRVGGRDKHHDTARTNLVKRLRKEVVVNCFRYLFRISLIRYRVISERNVADRHVHIVVGNDSLFKALNANVSVRIKVLRYKSRNAVKLYHSKALDLRAHFGGHSTHKVTDARTRLKKSAALKAESRKTVVHSLDNRNIGIVRVKSGAARGSVFLV